MQARLQGTAGERACMPCLEASPSSWARRRLRRQSPGEHTTRMSGFRPMGARSGRPQIHCALQLPPPDLGVAQPQGQELPALRPGIAGMLRLSR
jgi:hypothetical protein